MVMPFEMGDLGDGKGMWGRIRDALAPRRRHLVERMAEPVHRQNAAIRTSPTPTRKAARSASNQQHQHAGRLADEEQDRARLGAIGDELRPGDRRHAPTRDDLVRQRISLLADHEHRRHIVYEPDRQLHLCACRWRHPDGPAARSISSGLGAPIKFTPYTSNTGYWSGGGGAIITSVVNYSYQTSNSGSLTLPGMLVAAR